MGCCASIAPDAAEGSVGDVAENYCPEGRHHLEDSCFTDLAAAAPSRQSRSTSVPSRNAAASSAIENAKKRTTSSPPHRQPWVAPEAVDPALQPSAIGVMVGNCYACSRAFNTAAGGYRAFELPCGHQYHEACVEALLREHRACPTCGAAAHPATVPATRVEAAELESFQRSRKALCADAVRLGPNPRSPTVVESEGDAVTARVDDDHRDGEEGAGTSPGGGDDVTPTPVAEADLESDEVTEAPPVDTTVPVPVLPPALVFDLAAFPGEPRQCELCASAMQHTLVLLPCGDVFHAACADQWLAGHGRCPACKAELVPLIATVSDW